MSRQLYWLPQHGMDISESQLRSSISLGHSPFEGIQCYVDFATFQASFLESDYKISKSLHITIFLLFWSL